LGCRRAEFDRRLRKSAPRAESPSRRSRSARGEAPPTGSGPLPVALETAARATAAVLCGPGIRPDVRPGATVLNDAIVAWARTNAATKQEASPSSPHRAPRRPDERADARARRPGSRLRRRSARMTADQNLLFRWSHRPRPGLYRQLAAAGLGRGGAGTIADVTSCPGAEACKLAVTQSRPRSGSLRTSAPAAGPGGVGGCLSIKISGCPNGCGQHHIAGIGFQKRAQARDRAVPQYFVMVGRGGRSGARFGRSRPRSRRGGCRRRSERLIAYHAAERTAASRPPRSSGGSRSSA
jgi:sulfite reductase (NADPH) hemoprotein beta-component